MPCICDCCVRARVREQVQRFVYGWPFRWRTIDDVRVVQRHENLDLSPQVVNPMHLRGRAVRRG